MSMEFCVKMYISRVFLYFAQARFVYFIQYCLLKSQNFSDNI